MKVFLYKYSYNVTSDDTPTVRYQRIRPKYAVFLFVCIMQKLKKYLSYAAHYERMLRENLF
jgi:hypothetical protein